MTMKQLRSFTALCMQVMRHLLGHRLLGVVRLHELHHESPGCSCVGATLEQHHDCYMRLCCGYVVATSWLCYGCYYSCCQQERSCVMVAVLAWREETCSQFLQLLESPSLGLVNCGNSETIGITNMNSKIKDHTLYYLYMKTQNLLFM